MSDIEVKFPKAFEPWDAPCRYKVAVGGRGSSKSWTVARKLILIALQRKVRILCTRELQKSIKQSVHKLISIQIEEMGLNEYFDVTGEHITSVTGSQFIFLGIRFNTEEIKSLEAVDYCWIEESHSVTETSWNLIDPTIRKENSEIWITYNPRFKHDYLHKMFIIDKPPENSLILHINHDKNPWFPEVLRIQMEAMKERDYEKYLNIWEGEIKALADGAIFGQQISRVHKDGRLINVPIHPNDEVYTFWDIGKNDHTAIWFVQKIGMEYHFIDYYQNRLQEVAHYTKFIKSLDYNYGTHYLPHDADHDRLGMSRNIKEQFEDGGVRPIEIVPRIQHKETAIEMAREKFDLCYFHKADNERGKRVEKGYEALCNYRYKFKEDDDVFQQVPHHDWSSNGSDAFQQFAQIDLNKNQWSSGTISYPSNSKYI